jgi:hypothetical protein
MLTAAYWIWFGIAWIFILAVLFKHWYARERRDAEATEAELSRTRTSTDTSHIWDA